MTHAGVARGSCTAAGDVTSSGRQTPPSRPALPPSARHTRAPTLAPRSSQLLRSVGYFWLRNIKSFTLQQWQRMQVPRTHPWCPGAQRHAQLSSLTAHHKTLTCQWAGPHVSARSAGRWRPTPELEGVTRCARRACAQCVKCAQTVRWVRRAQPSWGAQEVHSEFACRPLLDPRSRHVQCPAQLWC